MSARVGVAGCWKHFGIQGDASCPRLAELVHCRNCETFSSAGRGLLDREPSEDAFEAAMVRALSSVEPGVDAAVSVVVFKLGEDWYALPTSALLKVVPRRAPHRIPHRTSNVLLGLINVDGELVLCASLAAVIGDKAQAAETQRSGSGRLLVLAGHGQRWACPVDDVAGVHRIGAADVEPVPVTLAKSTSALTRGVFALEETVVALLDGEAVLSGLARNVVG